MSNPTSKDESVRRWSGPNAENIETAWVTLRAAEYDSMRRDLDSYVGIATELAARRAAETKAPRYLRPSMGTGSMFASQYKMAVTDEWCRGWNALLSAQEAAGCETDSNSPWPPLVPCPDCKGAGEVCTGHSGRDDDGNAPLLETCETCDRYGRVAASSPKTSSEGPL